MPPCRLALRSLLSGSRSLARSSTSPFRPAQWRPGPRRYGDVVAERSQDDEQDGNCADSLTTAPAAAYIDVAPGPHNGLIEKIDETAPRDVVRKIARALHWGAKSGGHGQTRAGVHRVPPQKTKSRARFQRTPTAHDRVQAAPGDRTRRTRQGRKKRISGVRVWYRPHFSSELVRLPQHARCNSHWYAEFNKLIKRYDPRAPRCYLKDPGPPRAPPGTHDVVAAVRSHLRELRANSRRNPDMDQVQQDREPYDMLPLRLENTRTARVRWNHVVLWFLYHEPEQAIELLAATAARPYLSSQNVSGALKYLELHFRHCQDDTRRLRHRSRLADVFLRVLDRNPKLHLRFVIGGTIRHLIPHWTESQLATVWDAIRANRIVTTWLTVLHVARRLLDLGQFEKGLDAILEAKILNAKVDSYAFRSSCSHLLRAAGRQPSGLRVTLRLVDNLVATGLTLDLRMCNIVILNAIEAGDLNTAFSLYRSLVQNGLEADDITYRILLKGCRGTDDADILNETIRSAIAHVNIQQDERTATEVLYCLMLFHTKKNPENAFDIIADAYIQLFDTYPMRLLGVLKRSQPERRIPPTHHAIGIMLSAYLDHVDQQSRTFHAAREVYDRYRELVSAGVEPFASTISADYIPNLFLQSFIRTEKGLLSASQVIKDMQRPSDTSSRPVKQCPPTVQTWSIYLHGFTRHKKMELAEQVLTYMRRKGMEPDVVAWNTLVKGYAVKQDETGLLESLERLEAGGHAWTPYTADSVKWYRKQESLNEKLRQKEQKTVELNFVTDLKAQLVQKFELADAHEAKRGEAEGETSVSYKPFS